MADLEFVEVTSRAELRRWLEEHHTQSESIWLVTYKKSTRPDLHISWGDCVQEALCFGWIDSQARAVDDERRAVRLSPRRKGSTWSAINKAHIEELAAAGLMTEAGWAKIEEAKTDGSWEFLDDIEACIVPEDLAAALDSLPGAREAWDAFPTSVWKQALFSVKSAKRPETRASRIATIARKAARGERPV